MASRSRRGGAGGFGVAAWFVVILGLLVAFFQIPYDPGAKGIIEVAVAKSATVQTWTESVAPSIAEFFVGIIEGGDSAPGPNPGEIPPANPNPVELPESERLTPEEATNALNSLTVASAQNVSYNRDDWNHWSTVRTCWSVRDEVLYVEAVPGTQKLLDRNDNPTTNLDDACKVIEGEWLDAYSGQKFTNPSDLDIDHMLPLSYAARSGGQSWDAGKKEDFANSLAYTNHLIAVSKSENRSKGDSGPAEWKPTNTASHCQYAKDWIAISTKWGLSVTQADSDALKTMLAAC